MDNVCVYTDIMKENRIKSNLYNKYPPLVTQISFDKWTFALSTLGLAGVQSFIKTLLKFSVICPSFLPPVLFNKRERKAFC